MPKYRSAHAFFAVVTLMSFVCQGTWTLAGTTGGLSGTIVETATGSPIADAKVTVTSPSQSASQRTDATGHFSFVSLAPDTYSVSAEKEGYDPATQAGVNVLADQTQTLSLRARKSLKEIGRVTSRTPSDLVKPGTTADVYSVSAAQQDKFSGVGGGGGLNNAYSAIATVPGAYVPANQAGYYQTVHIRGGDFDQVGYELDGIPVNRSFDNYPSGSASSLGQQELQVYTGASPATSEGQGLAGYINQVIRTGTYPGFGNIDLGIGSPSFYHKASFEVGGATPNRNFSYYVGIGGYNQDFRYIDQSNGTKYTDYGSLIGFDQTSGAPLLAPPNAFSQSNLSQRSSVVNVHFGLPHKRDGGKDDIQLLYDSESIHSLFYDSTNDIGAALYNAQGFGLPAYSDAVQYNGPLGQLLPSAYQSFTTQYLFPNSPAQRSGGDIIPLDQRDTIWNNQEIFKAQYQKNLGASAYIRVYGYTYYSDWLQNGPQSAFANFFGPSGPDYELSSHTRGVSASFADQINPKNLLNLQGSYTTASTLRDNNTQFYNTGGRRSRFAVLVDPNHPTSGICYAAPAAGSAAGTPATPTTCDVDIAAATFATLPDAAAGTVPNQSAFVCGTGPCSYYVVENGRFATYNTVKPIFTAYSITDQFRPTDKLLLNFGLRYDRFEFRGSDTAGGPARAFWFNAFNQDNCITNSTGVPVDKTTLGLTPDVACPSGYSAAHLQNIPSQVLSYSQIQPRIGGTYTVNPDTVLRFSYGKYVEPPNAAYEQYNTLEQNLPRLLGQNFYQFGFTTPGHEVRPPTSYNTDFSFERHFKGTDMSLKLTPFLRKTQDQIQNFFLNQKTGFISGLNTARLTARGFELQLNKGDFSKDGLAGQLSFTYTNSYINFNTLGNGTTVVTSINQDIRNYNSYTSYCSAHASDSRCSGGVNTGGAPAPCYTASGSPDPACTAGSVANPYWNAPVQSLLDPSANYAPYDIFPAGIGTEAGSYEVPYVATLVLNYKKNKWAFTPAFQFAAGNRYGAPESVPGIDPATCTATLAGSVDSARYPFGAPGGAPYDATTCGTLTAIPDPYTGHFDNLGEFRNPSQFLANMQISYQASPRVQMVATFANVINRCFGGQKTGFTQLMNSDVCSYGIVGTAAGAVPPVGNVYNPGQTIPAFLRFPYEPSFGPVNVDGSSIKQPFNVYLNVRIKF